MRQTIGITAAVLLVWAASAVCQAVELVDTPVQKYGYALGIPEGFTLAGAVSDTTAWPGRIETPAGATDTSDEEGRTLTIWVNRTPVDAKDLTALAAICRRDDAESVNATGSTIHDFANLTIDGGYGYWYKEADKGSPDANHRWIARVFGNGAAYTICAAGPFGEFEAWGRVFERVIGSFRLVPVEAR